MKQKFSKAWKASSQPRKQRKYAANAPIHLKRKLLSVNLAKDLRTRHKKKNIPVRKGDTILVMRGKFKGKKGKVNEVKTKMEKIYVEGIQVKKRDGTTVNVPLKASNLQIIELYMEDGKRIKRMQEEKKESKGKKNAESKDSEDKKDNKKDSGVVDKVKKQDNKKENAEVKK